MLGRVLIDHQLANCTAKRIPLAKVFNLLLKEGIGRNLQLSELWQRVDIPTCTTCMTNITLVWFFDIQLFRHEEQLKNCHLSTVLSQLFVTEMIANIKIKKITNNKSPVIYGIQPKLL